jgi:hypothetical protein
VAIVENCSEVNHSSGGLASGLHTMQNTNLVICFFVFFLRGNEFRNRSKVPAQSDRLFPRFQRLFCSHVSPSAQAKPDKYNPAQVVATTKQVRTHLAILPKCNIWLKVCTKLNLVSRRNAGLQVWRARGLLGCSALVKFTNSLIQTDVMDAQSSDEALSLCRV